MNKTIPHWAIDDLRVLVEKYHNWKTINKNIGEFSEKLGWTPTQEEVYDCLNGIKPEDKLAPCGFNKTFHAFSAGYRFCGVQKNCECSRLSTVNKRKETMLETYGVEHALKSSDMIEKAKATTRKNFGVDHPAQSDVVRRKMRSTTKERFGTEYAAQHPNIKQSIKETSLAKYGFARASQHPDVIKKAKNTLVERYGENPFQSDAIRSKSRATNIERYGVDNPQKSKIVQDKTAATNQIRYGGPSSLSSQEVRNRSVATNMERFGAPNPFMNEEVKAKIRATNLENLGVENPSHDPGIVDKIKRKNLSKHYAAEISDILCDKDLLQEAVGEQSFASVAKSWGMNVGILLRHWRRHGLPVPASRFENEISHFLTDSGINFITNDKKILKGRGLDFLIPDLGIAIEFNGLYWHSTKIRGDHLYHRRKYEDATAAGLKLIMINEDEWLERSQAWTNRITNLIGQSERGKGARSLSLHRVSAKTCKDFCDSYHIQGGPSAIIYAIGAYDGDELVGVMAFNRQRVTNAIELIRYCTSGKSHPGLFSKMFRHAVRDNDYSEVLSFADLRHSDGGVYQTNGFDLVSEIAPDYRYVLRDRTYHKSSFTKKRIHERFGIDMSTMTEREAMETLGIPRIYDCGKLKFVWRV